MGYFCGELGIQPSELERFDSDDCEFWLRRLNEHIERRNKSYG